MAMLDNPILWSLVFALVISQGLKILIIIIKHRQAFNIRDLILTGGMPSSHSALVTALSGSIYWAEGISSLFLLSLVMTLIILRDAMGVRRTAGEEGKIITQLIKKTKIKVGRFHYALGHTPTEVVVGIVLGILSVLLAFALF